MEAWVGGERLHLGAEAEVISGSWFGRPAILKKRRLRGWRHPDLDRALTSKRMTNEVKLTIWLAEKGAREQTKAEAQALIDAEVQANQAAWDALPDEEKAPANPMNPRPVDVILP